MRRREIALHATCSGLQLRQLLASYFRAKYPTDTRTLRLVAKEWAMSIDPTVLVVIGTRPEAIKLATVIQALRSDPSFATRVVITGQHREMLDQVLTVFNISPDRDLDVMRPNQSLAELTGRLLPSLDEIIAT